MNTLIEEIRKRIKAVSDNTDEPGYDEYTTGQGVGLAIALQIIDEVVKEHPVPDDVQEASRNYADKRLLENKRELAESGHTRHFKMGYVCFAGYEIEAAFADGMLAERERMMKEAAYFPEYDSIVNKVFGAGNLESWELDEAKRLVSLAKTELLNDFSSCPAIKGWVARDENGQVWLYAQRPFRNHTVWTTDKGRYFIRIYDTSFPSLRWEDEPRDVEIIIKEVGK